NGAAGRALSLAVRDDGARPDAPGAGPEDRGRSAGGGDRAPAGRPVAGPAGHDGAVSARLELSDRPRLGWTLHRSAGAPVPRERDRTRGAARAVRQRADTEAAGVRAAARSDDHG